MIQNCFYQPQTSVNSAISRLRLKAQGSDAHRMQAPTGARASCQLSLQANPHCQLLCLQQFGPAENNSCSQCPQHKALKFTNPAITTGQVYRSHELTSAFPKPSRQPGPRLLLYLELGFAPLSPERDLHRPFLRRRVSNTRGRGHTQTVSVTRLESKRTAKSASSAQQSAGSEALRPLSLVPTTAAILPLC